MRRQRFTSGIRLLSLGMTLLTLSPPAAARGFEFLYIDANEGSASGGHVAIKFDKDVFHFQHVESGLLRLYRDDFAAFRFAYGYQENRTLHGHRIEVSEDFYLTLRDAFNRRLLIQNQQLGVLQALQDDLVVTAGLRTPESRPTIELKALGYFLDSYRPAASGIADTDTGNASPLLKQLRQRIDAAYGGDFLQNKRQQTWNRLQTLTPTLPVNTANPVADRFDPGALVFAQHYQNQLLNLAALDVLHAAITPRPDTLLQSRLTTFKLNATQIDKLNAFREKLFADLIRLMRSQRPDWGYPLLVCMARLHALDASLASGYLVVLDRSRKTDAGTPSASLDADALPAALQYTQRIFAAANTRLAGPAPLDERGYAEIEQSVAALLQVHGLSDDRRQSGKLAALTSTPSLPAKAELIGLPLASEALESYRSEVDKRLDNYREQLASIYGYDLVSRNCATEIFRVINDTLKRQLASNNQDPNRLAEDSRRLLGGYIDDGGLNMIPFVAFDQVGNEYRLHSSYRLDSYRETQLRKLYIDAPPWLVDLQESNLLSSTIYDWNGGDAAFLFFTQDAIWPRPLQGGINLAVAAGQAAYGLLSWPWDGGLQLQKSLKGMAVSVPELLFFNIRKGSFPRLLPDVVQEAE